MSTHARTLLALDAAGTSCSAAVWAKGGVVATCLEVMPRGQSERLVPMVGEVMARAGVAFADLDAVAVTRGPGGFTGVRIGLATARGLALAWRLPLLGVTCFETVAAALSAAEIDGRQLVVALDAKRSELYAQAFSGAGPGPSCQSALGPPRALAPADLDAVLPAGPLLLAGDAAEQALPALRQAGRAVELATLTGAIDAAWVASLAAGKDLDSRPATVQPLYLREPDVTLPARAATPRP